MATIIGSALDEFFVTTVAADILTALDGNDVILIASAADHAVGEKLSGGNGYDRIWFASSVVESISLLAGVTLVESVELADAIGNRAATTALSVNASAVTTALSLFGNQGANTLTGTAKNDLIAGDAGVDTIDAGAGDDRIFMRVDTDFDQIDAGLAAEGNTLVLTGAAAGSVLVDLSVAANADQLTSIDGDAELTVQSDFRYVDASEMQGGGLRITGSSLVNRLAGSASADTLSGGVGADILNAGSGDDVILIGNSTHFSATELVTAGIGADVLRFTSTTAGQTLTLHAKVLGLETLEISDEAGVNTGTTALNVNASYLLSLLGDDETGIELVGNDGANTITATRFADTLNGNAGIDRLYGGAGDDIYIVDNGVDSVVGDIYSDSAGTEDGIYFASTVAGETLTLGASVTGIEWVAVDNVGAIQLNINAALAVAAMEYRGNEAANSITAGKGSDTIEGNGGEDTINGGAGSDRVIVAMASIDVVNAGALSEGNTLALKGTVVGVVEIDLSSATDQIVNVAGGAEALVQTGFSRVDSSEMDGAGVSVTASILANRILGGEEDDVVIYKSASHAGIGDFLDGGDGDNIVRFTSAVARETLILRPDLRSFVEVEISDATGDNSGILALNLDASLVTSGGQLLTGNDGNNRMVGTLSDDTLNGNDGADTLYGGAGNDVYLIDAKADFDLLDRIVDSLGRDTLRFDTTIDGEELVLPSWLVAIEKFDLGDTDGILNSSIDGRLLKYGAGFTGNDGDNHLRTGVGSDTIDAGTGADTVESGAGNDRISLRVDSATMAQIDAGNASEGNTLVLKGDLAGGVVDVDLSVGANLDQVTNLANVQSDFTHLAADAMINGSVFVVGSSKANFIVGSDESDFFMPGMGADSVEGGGSDDYWIVGSQAEYDGDIYNDNGGTKGDYIIFDGDGVLNKTLVIRNNVVGVDAAMCGSGPGDTTNLNLDALLVDQPFGLSGNLGNNKLVGNRHGSSMFDYGGRDTLLGGAGEDDYVVSNVAAWVTGDQIVDSEGLSDTIFFAGGSGVFVVKLAGTTLTGIEQFVVSSEELSTGGPYIRENRVFNNGGIDATGYSKAIHLGGSYGNNALTGTAYNDTIIGYLGQDTIVAGTGADTITMETSIGDVDRINAGKLSEGNVWQLVGDAVGVVEIDLSSAVDGADQLISIGGAADVLVQSGFLHVNAYGMVNDEADAPGFLLAGVSVTGSSGANVIIGSEFDDLLIGGGGADSLYGGGGNDAFAIRAMTEVAVGEIMDGGGDNDEIWFASVVAGQTLTVTPIVAQNIEMLKVADLTGSTAGTTSLHISATSFTSAMMLVGNDGANRLTGTNFDDTLTGNAGADTLYGGSGNDVYRVEEGGEFVAGDGIIDSTGLDTIRFVSATADDTMVLSALTSGLDIAEIADDDGELDGTVALNIDASAVLNGLLIRGNDGVNTLLGTSGNDVIYGNDGNDSIDAGAGADRIYMALEVGALDDVNAGATSEGNTLVLSGLATGPMIWDLTSATDQLLSIDADDEGLIFLGVTSIDASAVDASDLTAEGFTITGTADGNALVTQVFGDLALDDLFITASPFVAGDSIQAGAGKDILRFASTTAGQTLVIGITIQGIEEVAISDATGDTSGTTALNINAATALNKLVIDGNDGANKLTGGNFADTITGGDGLDSIVAGGGADVIIMEVAALNIDSINAGLVTENNELKLQGTAAGDLVINLNLVDQLFSINGAADLTQQKGFMHLDASGVTNNMSITGTAGANRIAGGSGEDAIVGLGGADIISMAVDAGAIDQIDAGLVTEGNSFVLTGVATGDLVIDLSSTTDQLTDANDGAEGLIQVGFAHVDASLMTGAAVDVTGSSAANRITGTAMIDTIIGGAGADTVTMDLATYDLIDAGSGGEGDTLVLVGDATGLVSIDFFVAVGADQLVDVGGSAEVTVQSDFQHLDASLVGLFGVDVQGNGLNNILTGSSFGDTFTGLGGADQINLGTTVDGSAADGEADTVVFESGSDGISAVAARYSRDSISMFETGIDKVALAGEFNGGFENLDDIADDDSFAFASDQRADFSMTHEGLFISAEKSLLLAGSTLYLNSLASVVAVVNKVGVSSLYGDDGLIVVQSSANTGIYYYEEFDGVAGVSASELTMLGLLDAKAADTDFVFA